MIDSLAGSVERHVHASRVGQPASPHELLTDTYRSGSPSSAVTATSTDAASAAAAYQKYAYWPALLSETSCSSPSASASFVSSSTTWTIRLYLVPSVDPYTPMYSRQWWPSTPPHMRLS